MNPRRYPELVPADRFVDGTALILAPHPDDEVAACGGMVLHHADAGLPVEVAFLTDGSKGGFKQRYDERYVNEREAEARAACAFQGTRPPRFLRQPDGGLEPRGALVDQLATLLVETTPSIVYCPSLFEVHNDHRAAALALLEALDRVDLDPRIMMGEIGVPVVANVLVDISAVVDRKVAALKHYHSQLSVNDYVHSLEGLCRYRSVNIDTKEVVAVEAYLTGRRADLAPLVSMVDRLTEAAENAWKNSA